MPSGPVSTRDEAYELKNAKDLLLPVGKDATCILRSTRFIVGLAGWLNAENCSFVMENLSGPGTEAAQEQGGAHCFCSRHDVLLVSL